MDFGWSSEQEMWRKAVRDFAQREVTPRVREYDSSGEIPPDLIKGMAQMGLLAPTVPEAYGGMDADWTMACIAAEELGRADISLALPVLYDHRCCIPIYVRQHLPMGKHEGKAVPFGQFYHTDTLYQGMVPACHCLGTRKRPFDIADPKAVRKSVCIELVLVRI